MSYIKINGDDTKYYVSIIPFTTQHGYDAIRFKGENIPQTDKGFKLYDEFDVVISDFSDYKYFYRDNEYSVENDEIVLPKGSNAPLEPSAIDKLNSKVNQISSQVNVITPYIENKTAYIDDTYVTFDIVKDGNISIFMVDNEGQNVPFTFEQINGQVKVLFEKRNSLATVTIQIQ